MSETTTKRRTARTFAGVRDALFDALDDVRSGASDLERYKATVAIAAQIYNGLNTELKALQMTGEADPRTLNGMRAMLPGPGPEAEPNQP